MDLASKSKAQKKNQKIAKHHQLYVSGHCSIYDHFGQCSKGFPSHGSLKNYSVSTTLILNWLLSSLSSPSSLFMEAST